MRHFFVVVVAVLGFTAIIAVSIEVWNARLLHNEQAETSRIKADYEKLAPEPNTAATNSPPNHEFSD